MQQGLRLSGHILSLYDLSDSVGICQPLADKSGRIVTYPGNEPLITMAR